MLIPPHLELQCRAQAIGKADLEALKNVVASSFSINYSMSSTRKGLAFKYLLVASLKETPCISTTTCRGWHHARECNFDHLPAPTLVVKTTGTAQHLKQILHHLKRHALERESTGKSRAALPFSRWLFLAAEGHFRCGMLLNQLEEPVINDRC